MGKLKIVKNIKSKNTITRTIRIDGSKFDRINDLAEKNDMSFNSVVNQIIEFGLDNIAD